MLRMLMLAALLALAGCATSPVKQDLATELKASNVAVAYFMNNKNIHYTELVYKVFWGQFESQDATFDGLWDIDRDMSSRLALLLAKEGLMAESIQDVLKGQDYADFSRVMYSTAWERGAARPKKMRLDESTTAALAKRDIRYLIVEQRGEFDIEANSFYDAVNARCNGLLIIYDVQAQQEIYVDGAPMVTDRIKLAKPRDLETNKLAKLKNALHKWMDQSRPFYVENLRLGDEPG